MTSVSSDHSPDRGESLASVTERDGWTERGRDGPDRRTRRDRGRPRHNLDLGVAETDRRPGPDGTGRSSVSPDVSLSRRGVDGPSVPFSNVEVLGPTGDYLPPQLQLVSEVRKVCTGGPGCNPCEDGNGPRGKKDRGVGTGTPVEGEPVRTEVGAGLNLQSDLVTRWVCGGTGGHRTRPVEGWNPTSP